MKAKAAKKGVRGGNSAQIKRLDKLVGFCLFRIEGLHSDLTRHITTHEAQYHPAYFKRLEERFAVIDQHLEALQVWRSSIQHESFWSIVKSWFCIRFCKKGASNE